MTTSSDDFYCGDDFCAALANFRSYRYGVNSSETVEKIARVEKDYHKCSLCVTVCIATTY